MKKRMTWMLIIVGLLFGIIFAYKAFTTYTTKRYFATMQQIVTVTTTKANYSPWQPQLTATGSMRAIRGVNVTTELAGLVQTIYFKPGAYVKKDAVLVQLNADSDIAALHSLQANAAVALTTYNRDKIQYGFGAISKAVLDTDAANLKSLNAQVQQQAAIVAKKTIRAPFSGRLGISAVNPGQYVNTGDSVVTLQTLDPIWVDFFLPQQVLQQLRINLPVTVTTESFSKKVFTGKITTINPIVDVASRNVEVEATIANPKFQLLPGMFTTVIIRSGTPIQYLTLPQSAISYNAYGDIVYTIKQQGTDKKGQPILLANQLFVITGETRGDQIAIVKGLKGGETVVTTGQLQLKNGSRVTINNKLTPSDSPKPQVPNDH